MLAPKREISFSHNKLVYIIIPVHNRCEITLTCLERLFHFEAIQHFSVVVVDDGSTDGTSHAIEELFHNVQILQGDGNLWWTGAIALGMKHAYQQGADYFIWLNDDCELQAQTLSALVEFCQEHPQAIAGAQGMIQTQPDQVSFGGKRKTWKGYRYLEASRTQILPCDLLSGNIVCLPRAVIDAIGYPDVQATPHYGGDALYLLRAQKAGFKLYIDGRYPAIDLPGESSLYPHSWLTCLGPPHRLCQLVFNPRSGLSWRVWLRLNWEAYSLWGLIMFLKKYSSIFLITLLRYGSYSLHKRAHP